MNFIYGFTALIALLAFSITAIAGLLGIFTALHAISGSVFALSAGYFAACKVSDA